MTFETLITILFSLWGILFVVWIITVIVWVKFYRKAVKLLKENINKEGDLK